MFFFHRISSRLNGFRILSRQAWTKDIVNKANICEYNGMFRFNDYGEGHSFSHGATYVQVNYHVQKYAHNKVSSPASQILPLNSNPNTPDLVSWGIQSGREFDQVLVGRVRARIVRVFTQPQMGDASEQPSADGR